MRKLPLLATALFGLVTALPSNAESLRKIESKQEFVSLVAGKTLILKRFKVNLQVGPDGSIRGKGMGRPVSGAWQWRDGYFCRDLSWGSRDLGPNCQKVEAGSGTLRFTSDQGKGRSADFRLQ